jgi:hypothetical protein
MLRFALWVCLFSANTAVAVSSINISAETIGADKVEVRNANIQIDITNQPVIHFKTDLKQTSDKTWSKVQLVCNLPQSITKDTWQCTQGLFEAERIKFPFSLNLTPQAKGVKADITLKEASFSDEAGLHAAEKLSGDLQLEITQADDGIHWNNTLNWSGGELFWQPFYLKGEGHQLSASGVIKKDSIIFEHADLDIKHVTKVNFSGEMQLKDYILTSLDANMQQMDLATAYPMIFKPFLENTAFDHAEIGGKAGLQVSVRNNEVKTFHLTLKDVDIDDLNRKFAFYKINADIPWSYDDPKNVSFAYLNGHLLNVPLGKTEIQAEVNRYSVTAPNIHLPILDGALDIADVSAARIGTNWYWHLAANVVPISMNQLSTALKWPAMQGKVSAQIPQVTYSGGILTVNGEMVFNVFDGKATVTNLTLHNPLSNNPVLQADMNLRNLDLGDLTRTFSFGAIEGKLDGDVANLEMQNWKPVKLDAIVQSSPGKYQKKISQRAVQNISALGGAGAAAAIQRSFLRFFEQFNYAKLGLSCQLRNDICYMGGVESTPSGYIIVKGSGIPSITVMGYNKSVGWSELINRIKRITDSNTKAVVK